MTNTLRGRYSPLLAAASALVFLYSSGARADSTDADSRGDESGLTILSNATNVTHWGLGAGAVVESAPYKGYGTKFTPIPLLFFDDKWVHLFGPTLDLKVAEWQGVSFALRGKFAFGDGYKGSDAPILNGMKNRGGAFWYGPALAWHTSFGTLAGEYLLGGNKGQRAGLDFSKSIELGNWTVEPHIGVEWLSSKYVDYYFGVRPEEARAGRPEYTGKSTYEASVGSRVSYNFTRHQMVTVDAGVSRVGSGITDSPLAGKRYVPHAMIGYLYQFN